MQASSIAMALPPANAALNFLAYCARHLSIASKTTKFMSRTAAPTWYSRV
ncbi:hypothetical protein I7I53_01406 [Histoplasma capsulatum var. duboisii H88]|uniref:Uncharacterized protein n=1 Tax=Ajellomyces capsulatus (strain H88) TaxID=544711 RepID=A0A8A1LIY1_AJEC8|nr:hypothetical protein I7I53_01406 [Histoplasma capsulatum var. duboisii H88]